MSTAATSEPQPMSAAEIKLRARHDAEATTLKWTLRNEGLARAKALVEQQTAELTALRAAEKAGVPFAPEKTTKTKGRRTA
jgi:hypothetical protein